WRRWRWPGCLRIPRSPRPSSERAGPSSSTTCSRRPTRRCPPTCRRVCTTSPSNAVLETIPDDLDSLLIMARVALLDDYQGVALGMADWKSLPPGTEVVAFPDHLDDEGALAKRLADFDIVMAMRERAPFPRTLLVRATAECAYPPAELAWGLILGLMRRVPAEDRATREGRWQTTLGLGLNGKTLGVLGVGTLGSRVTKVGRAFEMEVLAWSQNLTAERAAEAGATLVPKDELLARSDIVSIHLVLGERTRGVIGARELGLMKRSAYLVNTSRGPLGDEAARV